MTKKTFKFTERLLMILSVAFTLLLVVFTELRLNEVTLV